MSDTTEHDNRGDEGSWWRRPAGGREVFTVALPLVVSSLSWTVMTFVDRMFLRWESGDAMAAAFSAGTVWFAVLCFPLGVCTYASTFVSQYHGAGQPRKIGPITWQAVWIALGFTPLLAIAVPLAPEFFALVGHGETSSTSSTITDQEISYFRILCYGGPAMLIAQALSGFYSGRGKTSVVMVVDATFAVVNLGLDYLWIFGHGGFPAMGIEGAAWATVVSLWLKAMVYGGLILQRKYQQEFATGAGMAIDLKLFRRLLRFGGSSGFQMLLDVAGYTTFILLVGRLGNLQNEATAMAFNISSLAFMPVWGISLATSILVGQHLGENRDDLAARATWTTLIMAMGYMAVISVLYVATPDLFLYGFFAGGSSHETPDAGATSIAIYEMSVNLLKFVAAYNLLDAMLMVFAGAIKGAGDMRFVLHTSIVMAALLATLSYLAVEVWELNVYGCWTVVTLWIWALGAVFMVRFLQGRWRTMRVIETNPEMPDQPDA